MSRERRNIAIVVGAREWAETIDPPAAQVIRTDDAYEALGRLHSAPAREPVTDLWIDAAHPDARAIGDAALLLDPAIELHVPERASSAPTIVDEPAVEPAPSVGRVESPSVADAENSVPTTAEPAPITAPEIDAADLGDVDLVEAILDSSLETDAEDADPPSPILESALAIARNASGLTDLRFVVSEPADLDAGVPARGTLEATGADADALAAWTEWLSRWLDLEARYRSNRLAAHRDELTRAWNRRYFHQFLSRTLDVARDRRRVVTLMVFDIDDFKVYNDEFGHEAGDLILRETVSLLRSVIRKSDRVCRIGGDEFAVVFADLEEPRTAGSAPPDRVETIARRFQEQVCKMRFPHLALEAPATLSISAGLAAFPWDGLTADALLRQADERLLESKRRGKNHITFGPGATDL